MSKAVNVVEPKQVSKDREARLQKFAPVLLECEAFKDPQEQACCILKGMHKLILAEGNLNDAAKLQKMIERKCK